MTKIIYDDHGSVDWNANGWPEPNVGAETDDGVYTTEGMPDDVFDLWLAECDNMMDNGWEVDW